MRLGFAAFQGHQGALFQNASEFDAIWPILAIPGRLRRFLDHPTHKPPESPETQTLFGPPGVADGRNYGALEAPAEQRRSHGASSSRWGEWVAQAHGAGHRAGPYGHRYLGPGA